MSNSMNLWAEEIDEFSNQDTDAQELLNPWANPDLYGHEETEQLLLNDINKNRLPHAIILNGMKGIGKITLAFRLARYLLADIKSDGLFGEEPTESLFVNPNDQTAQLISAQSHMDLKYITPSYENEKGAKLATRIIRVYLSRQVPEFLSKTAAKGGWKIVIIDEAELMNNKAQNAVLKTLEEPPPKTLLILVTSNTGSILPTIHSRCRIIQMQPLSNENMQKLMTKAGIPNQKHEQILKIANGSIGKALELTENNGLKMIDKILSLFEPMTELEKYQLAQSILKKKDDFQSFMSILIDFLSKMAKSSAAEKAGDYPEIIDKYSKQEWFNIWEQTIEDYNKCQTSNLDKQTTIIKTINKIAK